MDRKFLIGNKNRTVFLKIRLLHFKNSGFEPNSNRKRLEGGFVVPSASAKHKRKVYDLPFVFGGGRGIRTPVGLPPNGFQDRLVMTASICLRVKILNCILEKSDTTVFKTRAHTKNIVVSYATQPSLALSLFLALASQKTILNRFLLAPPL